MSLVEHATGGLRFAAKHLDGMPLFALRVILPGGACVERKPGQAWLCGRMLGEGTTSRDWRRLSSELEARGLSLSCAAGLETHGLAIDGMVDDWRWALEAAAEIIETPLFSEERSEWLKRQGVAELESLADQPEVVAGWAFLDQIYRPHPAGRPAQGGPLELADLTVSDCRSLHFDGLARGVEVSVAGAIDGDQVAKVAEALFAGGARARCTADSDLVGPPIEGLAADHLRVAVPGDGQTHLLAGHLTVDRRHPDVGALEILAVTLGAGAGLAGRLPTRLREADGLTYETDVATLAGAGRLPGRLAIYCACLPERAAEAEAAIREELVSMCERGPSAREVEAGRRYLLGQMTLSRETARQWCDLLAGSLFYRQPSWDLEWHRQRWAPLGRDTVAEAARRQLSPDRLKVTIGESAGSAVRVS